MNNGTNNFQNFIGISSLQKTLGNALIPTETTQQFIVKNGIIKEDELRGENRQILKDIMDDYYRGFISETLSSIDDIDWTSLFEKMEIQLKHGDNKDTLIKEQAEKRKAIYKNQLLGAIAVAAYSYMSLVPLIQPPIMKLFTTEADRKIVMEQLRPVSHFEKVAFPIMCTIVISLLLPSVTALIGMLMLGNLFKEAGCLDRLSDTAQNALMNTVTIMLATGTGLTMSADAFLNYQTILIIILGLVAFIGGTAAGVIFGKLMCMVDGGKTNPLIGSAGVSAVPMAARVSQVVGQKANPSNFLLMHAMGPNVAGVIGTAVAAGTMLAMIGPVGK